MYNNSSLNDYNRVLVLATTKQANMAVPRPDPAPAPAPPKVAPPAAQSGADQARQQRDQQQDQREWQRMNDNYRKAASQAQREG